MAEIPDFKELNVSNYIALIGIGPKNQIGPKANSASQNPRFDRFIASFFGESGVFVVFSQC